MLITETVTIKDRQFVKNYSDSGFYIERDGAKYSETYDPIEFKDERIYTETNEKIDIDPTPEAETDLTITDTLEMLKDLGVDTDD